MAKYVLAFRGQPDVQAPPDVMEKWGAWFGELGSSIADPGSRTDTPRLVKADDPGDLGTAVITGYTVINADSLDGAVDLARGCPGLQSGVSVEVAELLEM